MTRSIQYEFELYDGDDTYVVIITGNTIRSVTYCDFTNPQPKEITFDALDSNIQDRIISRMQNE